MAEKGLSRPTQQELPGQSSSKLSLGADANCPQQSDYLAIFREFESQIINGLASRPIESLTLLVGIGGALFYLAENGRNKAIRTYWDAVHYVATSLSVGYAKIFPETDLGKAIGALVMMVGPALSARALENNAGSASLKTLEGRTEAELSNSLEKADAAAIVSKLDEILKELKRLQG